MNKEKKLAILKYTKIKNHKKLILFIFSRWKSLYFILQGDTLYYFLDELVNITVLCII